MALRTPTRPQDATPMLTAYLFDREHGREVEDWAACFDCLGDDQVLWIDVMAPSAEVSRELKSVFGLRIEPNSSAAGRTAGLTQEDDYLAVTAVAISDKERDIERERVVVDCFVGRNWLLTIHGADVAIIDDFRETASGDGELGALDAPSFLADLLEWVVGSYLRAFDEIEAELEDFDIDALTAANRDTDTRIKLLIEARRRVGNLRRSLAPHRDVFATLSHSEFDPLSSEKSSERFVELTSRLDSALVCARDVKDAIASSFDVLIVRTEHRTNEIVKVLTLVSILLLPGALLAGIAGMNVNLKLDVFVNSPLFWLVTTAVIAIATTSLIVARARDWI